MFGTKFSQINLSKHHLYYFKEGIYKMKILTTKTKILAQAIGIGGAVTIGVVLYYIFK